MTSHDEPIGQETLRESLSLRDIDNLIDQIVGEDCELALVALRALAYIHTDSAEYSLLYQAHRGGMHSRSGCPPRCPKTDEEDDASTRATETF